MIFLIRRLQITQKKNNLESKQEEVLRLKYHMARYQESVIEKFFIINSYILQLAIIYKFDKYNAIIRKRSNNE